MKSVGGDIGTRLGSVLLAVDPIPLSPPRIRRALIPMISGRLPLRDLRRHRSQNDSLYFHRPPYGGLRVRVHALHGLLLSPPEKRTFGVLLPTLVKFILEGHAMRG
jgi:hypothetical protein